MIQILITIVLILVLQHNTRHLLNMYDVVCPFKNNAEILKIKGNLSVYIHA